MENKKKNDDLVIQLQNILACKREELKPVGKQNLLTTCSFKYPGSNYAVNINTLTKVSELLEIGANLAMQQDYFNFAQMRFGTSETFKYCGFTFDEWNNDIRIKIDKINYQINKTALDVIEKRLVALESEELRTSKELDAIMAILNK